MAGITLGARGDMDRGLKEAMRLSGTTHLVALSGYNIQVVVEVVFGLLLLFLPRGSAIFAAILLVAVFTVMAGAEASILRAAIMGSAALLAQRAGRPYSFIFVALWAAFLMTLADPAAIFSPGFQLSFASLFGIVYLAPAMSRFIRRAENGKEGGFDLAGNAVQAAAAQGMALPIILNSFGTMPASGVLANALILPLVPPTMFLGFLLSAADMLLPGAGAAVAALAHAMLGYELAVIRLAAEVPLALAVSMPFPWLISFYGAICAFIFHARKEERS